jgi:hypothetical protein
MRPVWLLDIDGVINAVSRDPDKNVWPAESWQRTVASAMNGDWPILFSEYVRDFINEMVERVEIRWHTTWQHAALGFAEAVGIVELPVQDAPEYHSNTWIGDRHGYTNRWWKIGAAERVVQEEERKLIWTDDDISFEFRSLSHFESGNLFIAPPTHTGLTQKNLRAIREYVDAAA